MLQIWTIFLSLFITLSLETFIYMFLNPKSIKLFLSASGINLISNFLMNIILLSISNITVWYVVFVIWEIATVFIESAIISLINKFNYWKTLLFAFFGNMLSLIVGLSLWPIENQKTTVIILTIVFAILYIVETIIYSLLHLIKNLKES